MKTILSAIALTFLLALSGYAQCTRHTEAAGRLSYCPPTGWTSKDVTGTPYKMFLAPPGATPIGNFNLKEEATTLSHNDYLATSLKVILAGNPAKGAEARKVIGWTDFTTDANLKGSRLVYESLYKGVLLRSTQFVFDRPGKKLIITFTARESDKAATDVTYDNVVKSLIVW